MAGWVYIMTNRRNGTLYVGTTVDLARRVWEHREGAADGFTKQCDLKRLVYAEEHDDILAAKQREMNIKHCRGPGRSASSTGTIPSGTTFTIGCFEDVGGQNKSGHGEPTSPHRVRERTRLAGACFLASHSPSEVRCVRQAEEKPVMKVGLFINWS
jgi:putative endonuclease